MTREPNRKPNLFFGAQNWFQPTDLADVTLLRLPRDCGSFGSDGSPFDDQLENALTVDQLASDVIGCRTRILSLVGWTDVNDMQITRHHQPDAI